MIQTSPLLIVPDDCGAVVEHLVQKLALSGIRAERSFDLQQARAVHTGCACPHHGTEDCNCQMIVLLVYLPNGALHTLVAHGCDGVTRLAWSEELSREDDKVLGTIIKEVNTEARRTAWVDIPTDT